MSASSGALVWSYATGNYVYSSPAVADGIVYVGSYDYKVYAFGTLPLSVSISPSSVVLDVGQSQLFTSSASGGTSPYTYQWYLNGAVVSGATGSTWTFTPSSAGSYTVYVNVTDSVSYRAKSNIATVTVNAALSVSVSPVSVTLDVGQSKLFTSAVSGGTSPYSYQWYLNNAPVSGATSSSWTFTPSSSGSFTVYVNATDNVGTRAKSNIAPVTVNPSLSVTVSPSSVVMDVGQSQLFTSSVSGGTSPFTYQWYLNGSPVSGATSSTWTYAPASAGSNTVYVRVTDAVSVAATSNTVPVTVNGLLSVSILPNSVTLDVGQSQLFTSGVAGGTAPYFYQWYLDDSPVSGAIYSTWTFLPTVAGSHSVYVKVTDSVGAQAISNTVAITVNDQPSVTISPASITLDVGQSQLFTSNVVGGTSPFAYQWYLNDSAVSGATNSLWTFTPSSAGSYNIYVNVTDSAFFTAQSSLAEVTVNAALSVTISPSSATLDEGQSQLFASAVSGGTEPYSYQWYLDDNPVSGATDAAWTFSPASAGSYQVYVIVTDSRAIPTSAQSDNASVTVNSAPSISILPNSAVLDVGQSQLFTSNVVGGTSPHSYQWYLNDATCVWRHRSELDFHPILCRFLRCLCKRHRQRWSASNLEHCGCHGEIP